MQCKRSYYVKYLATQKLQTGKLNEHWLVYNFTGYVLCACTPVIFSLNNYQLPAPYYWPINVMGSLIYQYGGKQGRATSNDMEDGHCTVTVYEFPRTLRNVF